MSNYELLAKEAAEMCGFIVAALTDEYIVDKWPMMNSTIEDKFDKALEIRVFDDNKEIKLFRPDIGQDLKLRVIDDNDLSPGVESFVQEQYLDINSAVSKKNSSTGKLGMTTVQTTGGGSFFLPIDTERNTDDVKVIIKYYITKDQDSGMAKIVDWRAAGFKEA